MKTLDKNQEINAVLDFTKSPLKDTRVVDSIKLGEWVRQGDVYLKKIDKANGWKETTNRQLAPGTTMGSRHTVDNTVTVLDNPNGAQVQKKGTNKAECLGCQIVAKSRFTVAHPEHADISLPEGIYQVYYQVDLKNLQRVQD